METDFGCVVSIFEQSLGEEHANVATALNSLARLLQATNRLAEAEPLSRRAVDILLDFTRSTGHAHPHLRTALNNYAIFLVALGHSEAEIRAQRQRCWRNMDLS